MDKKILKEEAIQKTLLLIDEPPENWRTFNDELHTSIIADVTKMKSAIILIGDEEPILECILSDSNLLITTDRIISSFNNKQSEIRFEEIEGLGTDYESENNKVIDGRLPKVSIISINGRNGEKLFFKIDSYYPTHFVKTLIINIMNYVKFGEWFWNPKLAKDKE